MKFEKEVKRNALDVGSLLLERLKVIFDDREMSGIGEREVIVNPQGKVKREDLEKLIESLAEPKDAPIRGIKRE